MKKVGFVITTHGNNGNLIKPCLESILKYAPDNSYFIVFANESNDPFTLDISNRYTNVECVYIEDQMRNHGLTGTWNQGIAKCFKNNCEIVVLSNHDLTVNHTLEHILKKASECSIDKLEYYGPCNIDNSAVKQSYSRSNPNRNKNKINRVEKFIVGFFLVFPKHVLEFNKLDNSQYFNNKYPFSFNEVDWYKRFKRRGGNGYIICDTIVSHKALQSWKILKNRRGIWGTRGKRIILNKKPQIEEPNKKGKKQKVKRNRRNRRTRERIVLNKNPQIEKFKKHFPLLINTVK